MCHNPLILKYEEMLLQKAKTTFWDQGKTC